MSFVTNFYNRCLSNSGQQNKIADLVLYGLDFLDIQVDEEAEGVVEMRWSHFRTRDIGSANFGRLIGTR